MSESKYKERALELSNSIHGLDKKYQFDIIRAMCQLAEEVEKENNIFYTFDQDGDMCKTNIIFPNTPLFVSEEDCIGFLKYQEDVYKKKINKLNLYTKEQVEELLQKQRELSYKEAITDCEEIDWDRWEHKVDKDSILNAKLEI